MAIPGIPSNLIVQQANGQVWLTWDNMAGATGYVVYRSTDGVNYSSVATPVPNSYLDTAVTIGTEYFYKVSSSNGSGASPSTNPQSAVPVMQGQMTLGQIRLQSQQRADRVNSNFVGTAEWNLNINQSAFELYDILTTLYEDYYVAPQALFQTDGVSQFYNLPDGLTNYKDINGNLFIAKPFYKLLGIDVGLALNSNAWQSLKKFNFIGRNRYVYPQVTSSYLGVFNMAYRLMGNQVELIPTPSAGQYLRLWYIPRMQQLLKDTDILDGVSGWVEYVIVDAAIKALEKEESDTSVLMAQKMALRTRIEESAMNRDAGQPDTISDTRSLAGSQGRYGGPNGDGSYGGW